MPSPVAAGQAPGDVPAPPVTPRASVLDPARPTIRLLRGFLALVALLVSAKLTVEIAVNPLWGVDVVIPIRAATRWLDGGQPYLASSFQAGPGYDVPYLYPPIFLPPFALLAQLPLVAVIVAGCVVCALAAYGSLRRLGLPPLAVAAAFLWPPVSGTIQGGQLQLPLFAAFTWLYWTRARVAWVPEPRDPAGGRGGPGPRPALVDGLLAGVIPAVKVSQAHAWVGLLRLRPRAAIAGLLALGLLAAAMLPVAGVDTWLAWLEQMGRASDPAWALTGSSLTAGAPPIVTYAVAGGSMLLALLVPRRNAGLWIGLLTVLGAPSLRMYGVLFAVPAMLAIRRELALLAAMLIATYTDVGLWLGLGIVVLASLGATRLPILREPVPALPA